MTTLTKPLRREVAVPRFNRPVVVPGACRNCHAPLTKTKPKWGWICDSCARFMGREYHQKNRVRLNALCRKYHANHKEENHAYRIEYYKKNRTKILEQRRSERNKDIALSNKKQRESYARHAEQRRKEARDRRAKDIYANRAIMKKGRDKLRQQVLIFYGGEHPRCECCHEDHQEFLTVDHINGGGNAHRRKIGRGNFYIWLRKNNFPPGFRILCHNCNWVLGHYGYCPHGLKISAINK